MTDHMKGEVDPTNWEECKAPVELEDNWKAVACTSPLCGCGGSPPWSRSPDGTAYHLVAERYFPGRGTWRQHIVIAAEFVAKAKKPGLAITGLLHSMVPEPKRSPHGIHLHEN